MVEGRKIGIHRIHLPNANVHTHAYITSPELIGAVDSKFCIQQLSGDVDVGVVSGAASSLIGVATLLSRLASTVLLSRYLAPRGCLVEISSRRHLIVIVK